MCSKKCATPLFDFVSALLPAFIKTPTAAVDEILGSDTTRKPFSSVVIFVVTDFVRNSGKP